ncbi:lipoprotein [Vibrio sp. MACH09]|uniref:hypothetical protein n=1 Tax=unclassified Vibrio TaxID=2614977 RepID=UPI001493583E|nr:MULTISPECIES: hypothetical protein [unclassified Vibrio]NOI66510.1 hypothetical protein [Vibrio sp. 99-8-1]GLO60490.1 lipoprotein [Vibrio sp. MACH09]
MRYVVITLLVLVLTACADKENSFDIKNLAKSDIDLVTDVHIKQLRELLRTLTVKLYKRNPRELKKSSGMTIDARLAQIMTVDRPKNGYLELGNMDGVDVLPLAFSKEFKGDRVFALMVGITGMLSASYNHKVDFYIFDEIDQQKLYNSARNLETVSWQLNNQKYDNGEPLLLSNGIGKNGIANYSYERVLGQMIILQDMMALLVSDGTNRTINKVAHGVASFTFFPI